MVSNELQSFIAGQPVVIGFMLLGVLATAAADAGAAAESDRPNVIVILSDDQGWADIGYNNPNVYSPNLDAMAAKGVTFWNHYVMPQCTPTRVACMTGRYPGRFGAEARQATNSPVFPLGTPTLASMFKRVGYETYMAGKWHMGSSPKHGPNHFGFDSSYGSLAGAVGMYDHRYRTGQWEHTWHRDLRLIEGAENGVHATDLVTDEVVRIVRGKREKPFFIYVAYHAVHTPLDERGDFVQRPTQLDPDNPKRWLDEDQIRWFNDPAGKIQKEPDPEKRLLLAAVHHLDDGIGRILKALNDTGQAETTLILFSSDNGPQVNWSGKAYPDDLRLTDFNQLLPMRGSKQDVWEGGIHVPALAYWPRRLGPKDVTDVVHIVDWFPTLAGLTGYEPEEPIAWDGVDLAPILFEGKPLAERDLYWLWNRRTNRWALRLGDWKIVKYGKTAPERPEDWGLYNLANDPKESHDVSGQHTAIRAELHKRYLAHRAQDKG